MDRYEQSDRGEGDVALITGGGSGIGAEIGRWLSGHGVDVVLGDVDEDALEEVVSNIDARGGGRVVGTRLDVTDASSVKSVLDTVREEFDRLDYLFANAGLSGPVELEDTSFEDWRSVIDVNLNGVFVTAKSAIPMLEAGSSTSHIIVTASISGRKPKPIMVPYRTSKAALIMLSRCLATALGPDIKVNALCPGRLDTPLVEDLYERRARVQDTTAENLKRQEEQQPPLERTPEYEDIVGVLDYILFQDGFVTGHEFHLDGGGHQTL